ncbi:SiaB family protein kinase [Brenneria izbisi]|uniref:SiaB family protein kinase n=1 Tax=Brenneria izbisi TaxID=2939450 RepID=A0AA41XUZ0_9GAMM|nr:SiaB family protein kinase [Brenneria izbisi]MCV9879130.1 SiaB family protein kinase [Brenneria izbisi]MCV9882836.1 SiaB family protein kinase [Brenneria izbisi]
MSETKYTEFFDTTHQHDITLYYVGYFSQNIISSLAETVRLQLEKKQVPAGIRRKLFSAFIEMVQNIIRYSAADLAIVDQAHEVRHGAVCIGYENGKYFLLSANQVTPEDIEKLRGRLEPLRYMTIEEIRLAYKASLRAQAPPWSKGADIGLLTVARDASEPLQFTFQADASTGLPTFYLKAII